MKQGKRPTRRQKAMIEAANLNPNNWLVCKALSDKLHLIHRLTGSKKAISALGDSR